MKIAINGFGRIGRMVFKLLMEDKDFSVCAINDFCSPEELAYLLKYDTNFRGYNKEVSFTDNSLIVDGKEIEVLKEADPSKLPWDLLGIDLVIECTGKFTNYDDAYKHITAGASKVIISAPCKGDAKTIVYGVNEDTLTGDEKVISAASCTTNCLAPALKVLNDNYKIKQGIMTTVHAYTNDQVILDVAHKKGIGERRGRAAAMNIIPTSTGAAKAIGKVIPLLDGKLIGSAIRVPVPDGSMIFLVVSLEASPSCDEIKDMFKKNISPSLEVTNDPIVSSDVIGLTCGCLVDLQLIRKTDDLYQMVLWYDNEMGYSSQLYRTIKYLMK